MYEAECGEEKGKEARRHFKVPLIRDKQLFFEFHAVVFKKWGIHLFQSLLWSHICEKLGEKKGGVGGGECPAWSRQQKFVVPQQHTVANFWVWQSMWNHAIHCSLYQNMEIYPKENILIKVQMNSSIFNWLKNRS